MNCFDIYWFITGLIIMSLIFVCGYRIGSNRGWTRGFDDAENTMSQRAKRAQMLDWN